MAEAGVAPGAVIDDAEGENLGADQEIPQQQAQGEVAVNIMNQVLIWIGFDVVANRQALRSEIAEIKDMVDLTEKDITELQESYAKRTQNAGRMYFGLQRTKRLKATLHWVQDFARVSEVPTLEGLTQESFKAAISIAAQRADIRKKEAKDASSVSSEASPGKLKDDKKWQEWITGFENMLSTLLGVNGVPLLYVIREKEEAEPEGHNTFVQKCIACAPLAGPHFEADARKVHQLATSFTQGETSEQWIKMHVKKQNGRIDLKALCAHYQGAGNTTRRIAEATRLRETLHYKNERSLSFATFLSKVQHMFNLFEEEDEPLTESAKFRFLMEKVQNPQLEADISALKVKSGLGGTSVSFTDAANLIAASVATLPESISKSRISSMNQTDASEGTESIYRNGKVYTGYYKKFHALSQADRDKVMAERERQGIKKGPQKKTGRQVSFAKTTEKELAATKRKLKKANRKISSLQTKSDYESDSSTSGGDEPSNNGGNSFGGREEKKKGKKSKKN